MKTQSEQNEFVEELSKFYSSWFEGHTPTVEYLQILLNLNDQYFNDGLGLA